MSAKEGSPFEKMNGATEKTREFVENAYSAALQSAATYNAKLGSPASTRSGLPLPMRFPPVKTPPIGRNNDQARREQLAVLTAQARNSRRWASRRPQGGRAVQERGTKGFT